VSPTLLDLIDDRIQHLNEVVVVDLTQANGLVEFATKRISELEIQNKNLLETGRAIAKAADGHRSHEKKQDQMLRSAYDRIASLERVIKRLVDVNDPTSTEWQKHLDDAMDLVYPEGKPAEKELDRISALESSLESASEFESLILQIEVWAHDWTKKALERPGLLEKNNTYSYGMGDAKEQVLELLRKGGRHD
jgi:hypothetical protein